MRGPRTVTAPLRARAHSGPMGLDLLAIVLGVAAFAIFLALIEGIDRI